jgi:diguanylate cyclase (GGDEF)-like protein
MATENEKQMRALVVDDEPVIKTIITTLLEMSGYKVSPFENSMEALEHAKKGEYDIIVTDYFMPKLNGIELIQKIKEIHPYIASILVTGVGSEQTVVEAFTKGHVNSYLSKPFNNDELLRIIRLAVKEQEIKRKEDTFYEELKSQIKDATKELNKKNEALETEEKKTKELYQKVKEEQKIIKRTNKLLEKLSITDGLTGLYNHRYFQKRIKEEFIRAKRYGLPLSCVMMDLDDFKNLNDTYGHQAGDSVLIEFSRILSNSIRNIDFAARYGGEEFVAIIPQVDIGGAANVAERFRKNIESHNFPGSGKPLRITASIGLASYPAGDIKNEMELLKAADTALYRAKNTGKNRVVVHTSTGEKPVGGGETLTLSEKRKLLSDVASMLNKTLSHDEMIKIFLSKIKDIYGRQGDKIFYSVTMINEEGEPDYSIHIGENGDYKDEIIIRSKDVAKTHDMELYHDRTGERVFSSIPIITDAGTGKERVLAVLNISSIIEDKDFLKDITNILSIALKGCK